MQKINALKTTVILFVVLLSTAILLSCTTPSQKRQPAQVAQGASEHAVTTALKKTRATRHKGMTHVAHAPRSFTPVKEEEEES